MKYPEFSFEMRRIPKRKRSIVTEFRQLMSRLEAVRDEIWKIDKGRVPSLKKAHGEFVQVVNLSGIFHFKSRSRVSLQMPDDEAPDHPSADDYLVIDFRPDEATYKAFISVVFPQYVKAFGAYRGTCGPWGIGAKDFEAFRTINERYLVPRVFPVDYLAGSLVESSFGMSAPEFVAIITPLCDSVRLHGDGVIIVTEKMLTMDECDGFSARILAECKKHGKSKA